MTSFDDFLTVSQMKTSSIVLLSLLSVQLLYSIFFLIMRAQDYVYDNKIKKALRNRNVNCDIFGITKTFAFSTGYKNKLEQQPMITKCMFVLTFPIIFALFVALPILLVYSIAMIFIQPSQQVELTLSFAGAKYIPFLLAAALIHELGHLISALMQKQSILGVGIGFRYCLPCFFVSIDDISNKVGKFNTLAGGILANIISGALVLALGWGYYAVTSKQVVEGVTVNGNGFENSVITNIAGCQVKDLDSYKKCLSRMKSQVGANSYYFDDENLIDQTPILRDRKQVQFGAVKVPVVMRENIEQMNSKNQLAKTYYLQTEHYIEKMFVHVLKKVNPLQSTQILIDAALQENQFCESSGSGYLCILPDQKLRGDIVYFVPMIANAQNLMAELSLNQLNSLQVVDGGFEKVELYALRKKIVEIVLMFVQISAGMAIVSLVPLVTMTDGWQMLQLSESSLGMSVGIRFYRAFVGALFVLWMVISAVQLIKRGVQF